MVIPRNKFKEIKRALAGSMDYQANVVICPKHCSESKDMTFCCDPIDVQEFYHHHPYDGDWYKPYRVRSLYETMILIEKQKLIATPFKDSSGNDDPWFIDLGKVFQDRMLLNDLHRRMGSADWYHQYSDDANVYRRGIKEIAGIESDLKKLCESQFGPDAAIAMWGLYVPPHSVAKPDFLQLKIHTMEMQTLGFIENQFKRAGLLEAFTPELKDKMEKGQQQILHPFAKEFDGDKVTATLHLNKSNKSDAYFLNRFDLELQKDGVANAVKQSFYINTRKQPDEEGTGTKTTQDVRFTFKKAYNALAGRPVYNTLTNQNGDQYKAWEKINFKNTQSNGNYEVKQYNDNYGFNLEKVLEKYPIKELAKQQYKDSLVDSLQRGNLQKATFVDKDGKEEKLLISPSITTSSLNVYTPDKQRIPTETLVEKGYIGAALAEELKNRFKQNTQEQKQQAGSETQSQKTETAQRQAGAGEKQQQAEEGTGRQKEKKTVANEDKPEKQTRTRKHSQKH